MIYDFNFKEKGSGFNIENLCDLPVIKVWNSSNVSQKERYVAHIQKDGTHSYVTCVCKDFRNDNYGGWNFTASVEIEEGDTVYYYYYENSEGGEAR